MMSVASILARVVLPHCLGPETKAIEAAWTDLLRLAGEFAGWQARDFFLPYLQAYRSVQAEMTYAKRSGHGGYLTRDFFLDTAAGMGEITSTAEAGRTRTDHGSFESRLAWSRLAFERCGGHRGRLESPRSSEACLV